MISDARHYKSLQPGYRRELREARKARQREVVRPVPWRDIIGAVIHEFKLLPVDLQPGFKHHHRQQARDGLGVAMILSRRLTNHGWIELAQMIGARSHNTARLLYHMAQVDDQLRIRAARLEQKILEVHRERP